MFKDGKNYDCKMKANFYGRKHTAETLAKMSATKKGKKATAETRAKMREAAKTKPPRPLSAMKATTQYVYHTPAGVFESRKQALQANNIDQYKLCRWCISEQPKYAGYYRVKKPGS